MTKDDCADACKRGELVLLVAGLAPDDVVAKEDAKAAEILAALATALRAGQAGLRTKSGVVIAPSATFTEQHYVTAESVPVLVIELPEQQKEE